MSIFYYCHKIFVTGDKMVYKLINDDNSLTVTVGLLKVQSWA